MLHVSNFGPDISSDDLRRVFLRSVSTVTFTAQPLATVAGHLYTFATFENHVEARAALKLNGFRLGDRALRVQVPMRFCWINYGYHRHQDAPSQIGRNCDRRKSQLTDYSPLYSGRVLSDQPVFVSNRHVQGLYGSTPSQTPRLESETYASHAVDRQQLQHLPAHVANDPKPRTPRRNKKPGNSKALSTPQKSGATTTRSNRRDDSRITESNATNLFYNRDNVSASLPLPSQATAPAAESEALSMDILGTGHLVDVDATSEASSATVQVSKPSGTAVGPETLQDEDIAIAKQRSDLSIPLSEQSSEVISDGASTLAQPTWSGLPDATAQLLPEEQVSLWLTGQSHPPYANAPEVPVSSDCMSVTSEATVIVSLMVLETTEEQDASLPSARISSPPRSMSLESQVTPKGTVDQTHLAEPAHVAHSLPVEPARSATFTKTSGPAKAIKKPGPKLTEPMFPLAKQLRKNNKKSKSQKGKVKLQDVANAAAQSSTGSTFTTKTPLEEIKQTATVPDIIAQGSLVNEDLMETAKNDSKGSFASHIVTATPKSDHKKDSKIGSRPSLVQRAPSLGQYV
ncbi:hypothetical protein LTR39_004188, partial [Cryomyces antarcticus]